MTSVATNIETAAKPNVIPPIATSSANASVNANTNANANANAATSNLLQEEPLRSKYKGVYRCGKRWKAQFQHQGVQFYLGMFDTEEEASEAYQNKARRYQSGKGDDVPTNYQNLVHNGNMLLGGSRSMLNMAQFNDLSNPREDQPPVKRQRIYSSAMHVSHQHHQPQQSTSHNYNLPPSYFPQSQGDVLSSLQARLMWERLTAIYQRLLLAKAVAEKMSQMQAVSNDSAPSQERENLLKSLGEEIVMLGVVKDQLEEAVTRYFLREISLQSTEVLSSPQLQVNNSEKISFHDPTLSDHMALDLPLDPAEIAVLPLTHLTTPLHPQPVLTSSQDDPSIQSSQKKADALPKVSEIISMSSSASNEQILMKNQNATELARGDTLLYDVPALPSLSKKSDIAGPLLSEISVLTNVNSLQQCHSLQYGFSSLDTSKLSVEGHENSAIEAQPKNQISDVEQMQKLQQLIDLQKSLARN